MTPTLQARPRRVSGPLFGALALTDAVLASGPERWQRARLATKPLLMPALATRTLTGGRRRRLLAAQAFSWGGDLALMGRSRTSFLAGVGFFSGAHVAYISALRAGSSTAVLSTPGRRRFLAASGLLAAGMGAAAARDERVLGLPVAAYSATLATMVATAAAVGGDRTEVLSGASLFLASDSILGFRTFLYGEERRGSALLEGLVMATYAAAQWRLGEGLSRR